jgi:hypothetical protein
MGSSSPPDHSNLLNAVQSHPPHRPQRLTIPRRHLSRPTSPHRHKLPPPLLSSAPLILLANTDHTALAPENTTPSWPFPIVKQRRYAQLRLRKPVQQLFRNRRSDATSLQQNSQTILAALRISTAARVLLTHAQMSGRRWSSRSLPTRGGAEAGGQRHDWGFSAAVPMPSPCGACKACRYDHSRWGRSVRSSSSSSSNMVSFHLPRSVGFQEVEEEGRVICKGRPCRMAIRAAVCTGGGLSPRQVDGGLSFSFSNASKAVLAERKSKMCRRAICKTAKRQKASRRKPERHIQERGPFSFSTKAIAWIG